MPSLYPQEQKRLDFLCHLEELRRRILFSLCAVLIAGIFSFLRYDLILSVVKAPIAGMVPSLIFLGPTEVFTAIVKICFISGIILASPFILYQFWAFISPAIDHNIRGRAVIWCIAAFFLLLVGVAFSYFIAIPAALKFLLNFGNDIATPQITLEKYLSFFTALLVAGGIIFEIPIIIGFLADMKLINSRLLSEKRPFIVIIFLILAAFLTPTQDIFNMLVIAVPMIILYEIGVILTFLIERHRK
ncbi:MAG TPA: twin-arginine translocase subunit TatC [Candidatus Omnitrophota bacterium]|nr:twin-arginine translocase subunit TatC [Candidatus Omnitrophota bacterium]